MPSASRWTAASLQSLILYERKILRFVLATRKSTPARKFRMLLHINPTRQRGKRTGSLARISGWYMTFFAAGVIEEVLHQDGEPIDRLLLGRVIGVAEGEDVGELRGHRGRRIAQVDWDEPHLIGTQHLPEVRSRSCSGPVSALAGSGTR